MMEVECTHKLAKIWIGICHVRIKDFDVVVVVVVVASITNVVWFSIVLFLFVNNGIKYGIDVTRGAQ